MKNSNGRSASQGYAMIVVICVMSILIALSLSLLLAASGALGNSGRQLTASRCRVMAESFQQLLSEQIQDSMAAQQAAGMQAGDTSGSIQYYLRKEITGQSAAYWEGADLSQEEIPDRIIRRYEITSGGESVEELLQCDGYQMEAAFYWQADMELLRQMLSENPEQEGLSGGKAYEQAGTRLVVSVSCSKGRETQTVTACHRLSVVSDGAGGWIWQWSKGEII